MSSNDRIRAVADALRVLADAVEGLAAEAPKPGPAFLTSKQYAHAHGLTDRTVRAWAKSQRLPGGYKTGRTWWVPRDAVPEPESEPEPVLAAPAPRPRARRNGSKPVDIGAGMNRVLAERAGRRRP